MFFSVWKEDMLGGREEGMVKIVEACCANGTITLRLFSPSGVGDWMFTAAAAALSLQQ